MQMMEYAKGTSMQVKVESETYDMPGYAVEDTSQYTGKEGVNFIDSASAWDEENKRLTVFVINRNDESDYPLTIDLKGFEGYKPSALFRMNTDDLSFRNSYGNDEALKPEIEEEYSFENGELKLHVKPLSWNVFIFEK